MNTNNIFEQAREYWLSLSSGQRRFATFALIIITVSTVFYTASPERQPRIRTAQKSPYDFSQPDMAAEVMAERLQTSIQSQKSQMYAMQQRMEQLENSVRRSSPTPPASPSTQRARSERSEDAFIREMNRTIGNADILEGGQAPFAPTPTLQIPPVTELNASPVPSATQAPAEPARTRSSNDRNQQAPEDAPPQRSLGVLSWVPTNLNVNIETKKQESAHRGFYVPATAFFDVSLLTGLDAATGNKAKTSPAPIALRVQDLTWLPNEVRQDVKGCFLLAEGIGDLSTERVNIRGISISCVSYEGEEVIDQKLLGYVADSDGKAGMRGEVVSKAGQLLAETMKIGFIQGLSEFFQFNARSLTVTDSGALSSPKSDDMGNALLGGTSSGIGRALDKVATYYMSLAEEVYPVIQVGATRSATFVVTQGTELVFDKRLSKTKEREHEL